MRGYYSPPAILLAFAFAPHFGFGASQVRNLLRQNRLDEALPVCRQVEVLGTTNEDNLFACAWVYFRSDQINAGEKMLERLHRHYGNPEYQLLLGYDFFKKRQYEDARRSFDSMASKHRRGPTGLTAQELSGELYEAQGQLDTAAFVYRQVVGDDPNRGTAQWGLGRYYLAHGDNARAKQHLERTALLWPRHAASRVKLATLYLNLGDISTAAHWLAEAYRINKLDPQVLDQMGVLFEKKGMINQAIKQWQKSLEIKKDDKFAKDKLSTYLTYVVDALIEAKQYKQALNELDTSGKSLATDPKLLLRRGTIYLNMFKFEKAAGDFLAYVNSNPKDPLARRQLGICYLNLKLNDQALDNFSRALEAEPTNGINYAWMAYVLESQGRFTDAKEAWQKALELMKDPKDLERANRRLASVEKKLGTEKEKNREKAEKEKEQ
jgi:tetratricopeptide (TPR) repeat protein